jgi:hypothetical protein
MLRLKIEQIFRSYSSPFYEIYEKRFFHSLFSDFVVVVVVFRKEFQSISFFTAFSILRRFVACVCPGADCPRGEGLARRDHWSPGINKTRLLYVI